MSNLYSSIRPSLRANIWVNVIWRTIGSQKYTVISYAIWEQSNCWPEMAGVVFSLNTIPTTVWLFPNHAWNDCFITLSTTVLTVLAEVKKKQENRSAHNIILIIKLDILTMSRHVWFMIKIDGRFKWEPSMTSMTLVHVMETVETIERPTVRERWRF
jgi:hypothetical protein